MENRGRGAVGGWQRVLARVLEEVPQKYTKIENGRKVTHGGKAGEKYMRLLNSIKPDSIPPTSGPSAKCHIHGFNLRAKLTRNSVTFPCLCIVIYYVEDMADLIMSFLSVSELELLKKGVFGYFMELGDSLSGCLRNLRTMVCGSYCRYMIGFPYALNICAFEVFPALCEFLKYKAQKLSRMLCWGPSKQPVYRVIIDNFFHAEHGVVSDLKKKLDDERTTIDTGSRLNSRFEELDKKIVRVINAVDNLICLHDETKSCFIAAESVKRTCLESRIDGLESKFVSVIYTIESLVRVHRENKSCLACGFDKRHSVLADPMNDVVKFDLHSQTDLQPFLEDMLCKSTSTIKESAYVLHILCDAAASTPNELYGKTQTLSQIEEQITEEKKTLDLKAPNSNEGLPSPNPLKVVATAEVSRKRHRCENGIEDDSGFPHWDLITPYNDSSTVDKQFSGIDTNFSGYASPVVGTRDAIEGRQKANLEDLQEISTKQLPTEVSNDDGENTLIIFSGVLHKVPPIIAFPLRSVPCVEETVAEGIQRNFIDGVERIDNSKGSENEYLDVELQEIVILASFVVE
ncbi:hypothetical protein RND71_003707 [Anisodus tanguticus]|uniref:Uncharacterized protein n=1 Tax=Anisodus tanguticus TaxID=243964 RepID=A0AAE1VUC1_9SOLA|nr:hypothetical protein RND71_003707 [Anisodus tanguticus]